MALLKMRNISKIFFLVRDQQHYQIFSLQPQKGHVRCQILCYKVILHQLQHSICIGIREILKPLTELPDSTF